MQPNAPSPNNENQPNQPPTASGQSSPPGKAPPSKPRKKRRLLKFVLVLFILLLVVVGAAPSLLSTQTGVGTVVSLVNDQIQGHVQVAGLDLSWVGKNEIRNVVVKDDEDREVLKVDRVTLKRGAWELVLSLLNLGEIEIDKPQVTLLLDQDNMPSIARAFQSRKPSASTSGELPDLHGKVIIRDGTVKTSKAGVSYDVPGVNGEVSVASLSTLAGKVDLKLADGTQLSGDADLRDLVTGGVFRPAGAAGTLNLKSSGPVTLGPILKVIAPDAGIDGALTVDVQAKTTGGDVTADFNLAIAQLRTAQSGGAAVAPVNLALKGQAARKGDAVTATSDLVGDAGTIQTRVAYTLDKTPAALTADDLLAAVFSGKSIRLPDFTLDASGAIDLAKLQKAVPGLLKARAGQEVSGGRLEVTNVAIRGGSTPTVKGSIAVKDLAASGNGRAVRVPPITLDVDAALQPGKGLQIASATLKSGFAEVTAQGGAADLKAQFRGSLAELQSELGQVFDLSGFQMGGEFAGDLQLARAGEDRVNVTLDARTQDLRYGDGRRVLDLGTVNLKNRSVVHLANQSPTRVDIEEAVADFAGQVLASAKGSYDLDKRAYSIRADVTRADLGYLAPRAASFGAAGLGRMTGAIALQATADCPGSGAAIASTGSLTATNVTIDGKPTLDGETRVSWSGLKIAGDDLALDSAKITGSAATLDAKGVRWHAGAARDLRAEVSGNADLARLLRTIAALGNSASAPAIAGHLSLDSRIAAVGSDVSITLKGGIDDLAIGEGSSVIREKRVDYDIDGRLDTRVQKLTLAKARLASGLLTAEATGTIDQIDTARVASIRGRYDAGWDAITALLHEVAPATAQTIVVQGRSSSEFEISGPMNTPGAKPTFRGLAASTTAGWGGATLYGIPLGAAKLQPALKDGVLTIPQTAVAVSDGKVNLRGVLDFAAADPTLRVSGHWPALENVAVTPQLGTSLLSRINPIFGFMTRIEGKVHMSADDLVLPLGEAMKHHGAGTGTLDLREMKMQPGGFFGELCELGGMPVSGLYPVEIGKVDFVIKDGRIYYDNFVLKYNEQFDILFHGSVGLDDSIDLIVSLPVSEQLLARVGVKSLPVDLTGLRIDIPMVGTRDHPKLDFAKVDGKKVMQQLLNPNKPDQIINRVLGGGKTGEGDKAKGGAGQASKGGDAKDGKAGSGQGDGNGGGILPGIPGLGGNKPKSDPPKDDGQPRPRLTPKPRPKAEPEKPKTDADNPGGSGGGGTSGSGGASGNGGGNPSGGGDSTGQPKLKPRPRPQTPPKG